MLAAVTAINRQIRELAPVLNSPTVANGVTVHSSAAAAPIAAMVKRSRKTTMRIPDKHACNHKPRLRS